MVEMKDRLVSLDAFRGLTIAFMILVNTPGSWAHVYPPLRHAHWHGCTLTDLVFPFFLFIVGVAMRFSLPKYTAQSKAAAVKKILGRTLTIFMIGLLLNLYPFLRQDWDWSHLRIMGVLQRIALAYGLAALTVLRFKPKQLVTLIFGLLLGYWLLLLVYGWMTGVDPYGLETNPCRWLDLRIFGPDHLWHGTGISFDPEGLLSTIPSIATVLFGFLVGNLLYHANDRVAKARQMALLGAVATIIGWLWGLLFPINKQLWTSSYVLFTGGIATMLLACFYWLIDIKGWKKWAFPLVIFGTNSLFIFAGSGVWVKTILRIRFTLDGHTVSGYAYLYKTVFQPLAGDLNGSLLFALFHVFMWWLILAWMYRKKIFVKI
jgi:predicted acyltransferase